MKDEKKKGSLGKTMFMLGCGYLIASIVIEKKLMTPKAMMVTGVVGIIAGIFISKSKNEVIQSING